MSRAARLARSIWLAAALVMGAHLAHAAPDTIKVTIGALPGSGYDQTGRAIGAALIAAGDASTATYDNRTGGGGTVALSHFLHHERGNPRALLVVGAVMVGAAASAQPPVWLHDATPVSRLHADTLMLAVPAASALRNTADLLDKLRATPASVTWAGGPKGSADHLLAGLIAKAIGLDPARLNYVPFSGGNETSAALLSGHVTVGVASAAEFMPYLRSGQMRALAVSSAVSLDTIPSLKSQGVDVEMYNWRGVYGAPGLNAEQRDHLVAAIGRALASPSWQESLKKNEWRPFVLSGEPFGRFVDDEQQRLRGLLRDMGAVK